ncbi:hypothetical protein D3C80_1932110 [compost metagenome]
MRRFLAIRPTGIPRDNVLFRRLEIGVTTAQPPRQIRIRFGLVDILDGYCRLQHGGQIPAKISGIVAGGQTVEVAAVPGHYAV